MAARTNLECVAAFCFLDSADLASESDSDWEDWLRVDCLRLELMVKGCLKYLRIDYLSMVLTTKVPYGLKNSQQRTGTGKYFGLG